jgi:hypothetical protein
MKTVPFADHASLAPSEREALAEIVAHHRGLDDIFEWGRKQAPPLVPDDVVKQDEFTHDVLVPFPGGRWLVYWHDLTRSCHCGLGLGPQAGAKRNPGQALGGGLDANRQPVA